MTVTLHFYSRCPPIQPRVEVFKHTVVTDDSGGERAQELELGTESGDDVRTLIFNSLVVDLTT